MRNNDFFKEYITRERRRKEEMKEWIPVKERVPEVYERVLITYHSFYDDSIHVGVGWLEIIELENEKRILWEVTDEELYFPEVGCPCGFDVLAWRRLPDPYRG